MTKEEREFYAKKVDDSVDEMDRLPANLWNIQIQADIAYQLTRIADYMDIACMAGWLDFNNKKEVPDDSTSRT